jgi:phosphoribosyl 1,2-cyclic phosphodiesterase
MQQYLRYASLGSGSSGNALVIEARCGQPKPRLLLDCGFSVRETSKRLARLNLTGQDIHAVLITHEHDDHIGGAARFARKFGSPLYMSRGTYLSVMRHATHSCDGLDVQFCRDEHSFSINDLSIHPYTVPHDAREPLQFTFSLNQLRLGVLTDVGHITHRMIDALKGCHGLVLEYNYDAHMMANSKYPPTLRHRITGDYGHLDNNISQSLLLALVHDDLHHVHAAHISQNNNQKAVVQSLLEDALRPHDIPFALACQDEGFDWFEVV